MCDLVVKTALQNQDIHDLNLIKHLRSMPQNGISCR